MFDFHKAEIKDLQVTNLEYNSLLEFSVECNTKTGELNENCKIASFYGMEKFCIIKNDTFINFQFSLHKYFNKGRHNHNDFKISNFVEVLKDLSIKFGLNPISDVLHNLEFGVNITLPFNTQDFLNSIVNYKGKEYKKDGFNGKGCLLTFEFDQYELKIYDKGYQNQLDENILRIEIKVVKMHYLQSKGIKIYTYADLLNNNIINKLKTQLLKTFNELLTYDNTINVKSIKSRRERERLLNGKNPKYWSEIQNPNTFKKNRLLFRKLVLKYGKSNIQKQVFELLKKKLEQVIFIDIKTQYLIDQYLESFKTVPDLTNFEDNLISDNVPDLTDLYSKSKRENVPEITVQV